VKLQNLRLGAGDSKGGGANSQNARGFNHPAIRFNWGWEQDEILSIFKENRSGVGKGIFD